jgi:hypothetical protein
MAYPHPPLTERHSRFAKRGPAVATLMDAGYTHFQDEDGSLVKLLDLIEYDLSDAPRLSAEEAKAVRDSDTRPEAGDAKQGSTRE